MLVRFLQNKSFSPDGVTIISANAGEVLDVPEARATRYLESGVCTSPETKAAAPPPENKTHAPPAAAPAPRAQRSTRRTRKPA